MNHLKHKALNAYVAKYVMELPCFLPGEVKIKNGQGEDTSHLQDPPAYSIDKSLAISILDHMFARGFAVSLNRNAEGWSVSFNNGNPVTHNKLAIAICVGALQAVGIDWFSLK